MSGIRYPYTYACDHIRMCAGHLTRGTKINRGDAVQIIKEISNITGIEYEELSKKIADKYLEKNS